MQDRRLNLATDRIEEASQPVTCRLCRQELPDMKVTFVLWTLCAVLGSASTRSLRLLGDGSHPDAHNITSPVSVASSRGSPIPFLLAMQTRGREERVPLQAEPNIQVVSKKPNSRRSPARHNH
ncbi:uncharacterized protein LOC112571157 [Pomacea canaliculata]|uniref:uncharacterized protein LOC112571157 n=1 Tax=Pomacea canaliculata TaxID=400727 RepID=UPI000D73EDDA|nr:uncharacterized protein LOC112571157 [Pomacea canaliculata]